ARAAPFPARAPPFPACPAGWVWPAEPACEPAPGRRSPTRYRRPLSRNATCVSSKCSLCAGRRGGRNGRAQPEQHALVVECLENERSWIHAFLGRELGDLRQDEVEVFQQVLGTGVRACR